MSKDLKKTLAFMFFLLAGILIGSAIAYFTRDINFLSWLSYSLVFGIPTSSPIVIDLAIFKFALGLELNVSISHVIFVILAIVIYCKTCKSL